MVRRAVVAAALSATALGAIVVGAAACRSRGHRPDAAPPPPPDAAPRPVDAGAAPPRGELVIDGDDAGRHRPLRLDPATGAWVPLGDGVDHLFATGHRVGGGLLAIATRGDTDADHTEQLAIVRGAQVTRFGPSAHQVRNPTVAAGVIAIASDLHSYSDVYVLTAAEPPRRLTDDRAGNFEPALAPDGARVAFASSRDGDAELYVQPVAAGGPAQRLTVAGGDDWSPAWSPDGGRLAFLSDRSGAPRVYVVPATGGDPQRLSSEPGTDAFEDQPAWSPDGARVAFVRQARGGRATLVVIDVATRAPHTLTPDGEADHAFAWSPDGRALVVARTAARGAPEVVIVDADGGAVRQRWPGAPAYVRWLP